MKDMWGQIAAETSHYRWVIFGNGTITKSLGYPDPYVKPPPGWIASRERLDFSMSFGDTGRSELFLTG